MFFRRIILKNALTDCRLGNGTCTLKCSFCRFQKCLQAGMEYRPYAKTHDFQNNDLILPVIIKTLVYMDNNRIKTFRNCYYEGDETIDKLPRTLRFIEKPKDFKLDYNEWSFMNAMTGIDFLKKIHFLKDLNQKDISSILKTNYVQFMLFSLSQAAYFSNQSSLSFPDGTKIPEDDIPGTSPEFRRRIRCRVIDRLVSLKVTREECLLLTMVFLCHPGEL
uniref:Nuclear receptor domain-containing protein n=1 Tax=Caenorhabditis tropicalis TaxID=1561998 RepID=A0A1I7UWR2_9PELO